MDAPVRTTDLARLLKAFFHQRLIGQRNASRETIYSYRDTLKLLLHFGEQYLGKAAAGFSLADIDATLVLAFLDNLETHRHNCIRSRNARLAAIRSFLQYAALQEPLALPSIQQVLAIPMKRFDRPMIRHLTSKEMQAIIDAPDATTWNGLRDHALFAALYNTGARVSEIISVRRRDFDSNRGQSIHFAWQGTERARSSSVEKHRQVTEKMADANRAGFAAPTLPQDESFRSGVTTPFGSIQCGHATPLTLRQNRISPCHQAHYGNAFIAGRGRSQRYRLVARACEYCDNASVSRS